MISFYCSSTHLSVSIVVLHSEVLCLLFALKILQLKQLQKPLDSPNLKSYTILRLTDITYPFSNKKKNSKLWWRDYIQKDDCKRQRSDYYNKEIVLNMRSARFSVIMKKIKGLSFIRRRSKNQEKSSFGKWDEQWWHDRNRPRNNLS